ncbi:Sensory box histidine kinase/response regulator [Rhodovulum sp. P5]|uniref:PAS domain S-box protein n=1 Tax=Rhodovulum sp. P5 TaxID=1564506 RepID=UPI0009C1E229|nr:PAS domain S-box protein [Rhodovulum sp. P5]ARE41263.1 Sensory box histidine kinase/response regulator [Rhodovulum sp. P5]
MENDERLRESLLELQVLRDRERQAHQETSGLLSAIEGYARAKSPALAVASLFGSLNAATGAATSVIVEQGADDIACVLIGTDDVDRGKTLALPAPMLSRARNVADLSALGDLAGSFDTAAYLSMVCTPLEPAEDGRQRALLCFGPNRAMFTPSHMRLVTRLARLFAPALETARLAADNALLAAVIEGASAGFAITDTSGNGDPLVYVNRAFEDLTGYTADEVVGKNCRFLSDERLDATERARLREAVQNRSKGQFLLRNRRKDGEPFWNELTLFPVRDAAGNSTHLVATQTDVSARVEAELERDKLRKRMTQALTMTEDAFLLLSEEGEVLLANDAMRVAFPAPGADWEVASSFGKNRGCHITHLTPVVGTSTLPSFHALREIARFEQSTDITLANGKSYLLRCRRDVDGTLVLTATEITRVKKMEALLRQRLAAIEATFDGIVLLDEDERIVYMNGSASAMLGYSRANDARTLDWRSHYVTAPEEGDGKQVIECKCARDGAPRTHEITRSTLDGGRAVLILRDITERLAEENRQNQLRGALARAQKQEALTQLAAGIAHDFNNLLSVIHGSASMIRMDGNTGETGRDHARRILTAGERAARLVNRLLDIGGEPEMTAFELHMALSDVTTMMGASLPSNVSLDVGMEDELMLLRGDPGTLNQICVNLILNAADAMPAEGGEIDLSVTVEAVPHARALSVGMLGAGQRYARVEVADTGSGMDADTMAQIFEPHFTTKGARGTGLGLTMVALESRSAGGGVEVHSTPGEGSSFVVYWPLEDAGAEIDLSADAPPLEDLSGQSFLIIDDDLQVGEVLQAYLESRGAEVAFCEMPEVALDVIEEEPEAWTAIISDYDMVGMNGGDLVERLGRTVPDLPVILITALARRLTDPRVAPGKIAGLIAKPVDLGEFERTLSAVATRREMPCAA